jgi:hypothetical protein
MLNAFTLHDEAGDWREAKFVAEEARQPLEQARTLLATATKLRPAFHADPTSHSYAVFALCTELESQLAEYESRRQVALSRSEVEQYLCIGDELMTSLLQHEENLNMDLAWTAADTYKQAVLLAKEHNVEGEAIASSRLGKLYDKVLKLEGPAKQLYKHAVM